jgi:hypothetical protein
MKDVRIVPGLLGVYFGRDTYSGGAETWALVGLRCGFACCGVFVEPRLFNRKRQGLARWLPLLLLAVWWPIGQCGQRWLFRIELSRLQIGWRTRGSARLELSTYYDAGLYLQVGRQRFHWFAPARRLREARH